MPSVTRVPHKPTSRLLNVVAVDDLTPSLRRITLSGDLGGFWSASPDDHVKMIFPDIGERAPRLPPAPGSDGPGPSTMRDYTPRAFDVEAGTLVVEFVLHGHGPAVSWARGAVPGTVVGQAGPRGSRVVSDDFDWYLLAGDETALPAIARRLEELPRQARVTVGVEVQDGDSEIALATTSNVDLTWLHRGRDGGLATGEALQRFVRGLAPMTGDGFAWVACEAETARVLRGHLREERGLSKAWTSVTGYWKQGVTDHHDPPDPE